MTFAPCCYFRLTVQVMIIAVIVNIGKVFIPIFAIVKLMKIYYYIPPAATFILYYMENFNFRGFPRTGELFPRKYILINISFISANL